MNDWSTYTVNLPKLLRQINALSNNREYVAAMAKVVEMRAELGLLKNYYIEEILRDDDK